MGQVTPTDQRRRPSLTASWGSGELASWRAGGSVGCHSRVFAECWSHRGVANTPPTRPTPAQLSRGRWAARHTECQWSPPARRRTLRYAAHPDRGSATLWAGADIALAIMAAWTRPWQRLLGRATPLCAVREANWCALCAKRPRRGCRKRRSRRRSGVVSPRCPGCCGSMAARRGLAGCGRRGPRSCGRLPRLGVETCGCSGPWLEVRTMRVRTLTCCSSWGDRSA